MKQRIIPIAACLASAVLMLAYAYFRAQLPTWLKSNGGGIPYVVFWTLFWFCILPSKKHIVGICVGCVLFTCLLEFGQLWNPEPLATFRQTRFGAALLGSTFVWDDIPPYFLGGIAGYFLLNFLTGFQPGEKPGDRFT